MLQPGGSGERGENYCRTYDPSPPQWASREDILLQQEQSQWVVPTSVKGLGLSNSTAKRRKIGNKSSCIPPGPKSASLPDSCSDSQDFPKDTLRQRQCSNPTSTSDSFLLLSGGLSCRAYRKGAEPNLALQDGDQHRWVVQIQTP